LVAAVVASVVAVSAVRTGCRGSYCSCTDRSAIRIIPATVRSATIRSATIRRATIGYATARNSPASDTCRANSSAASTGATTVSERVIGNKGHAYKEGGCETYESIAQHWCSPSLTIGNAEQRGVAINKITML
jgi:hypothetical protein